jgi:hypothetical protein
MKIMCEWINFVKRSCDFKEQYEKERKNQMTPTINNYVQLN